MSELSIAAYARHRGCSRQAVYLALNAGRIFRTESRKIDPVAADRAWLENTASTGANDPEEREPGDGEPVALPWKEARALKETYLARLRQLEYRVKSGEFVSAVEAAALWDELARRTREGCLALADRLADELAAETNPFEVHRLLSAELRQVLETLSSEIIQEGDGA